ncbi:VTC domain-containing protein [Acetobacterium malicum]|uniref:VTC domain-containing protein n=1 Tax=Acetobacterium malicum TaxID=52692 RepID=UPI0006881D18|nr:VTC domain-containing protein [Acetobacterium dehalogenans]
MVKNEENNKKVLTQFILVHRVKIIFSNTDAKKIKRNKDKLVGSKHVDNNIDRSIRCKKVLGRSYEIMNRSVSGETSNKEHKIIIDHINDLKKTIARNTESIEILNKNMVSRNSTVTSEKQLSRDKKHLSQRIEEISTKIDEIMELVNARDQNWSESFQTAEKKLGILETALANKENHVQALNNLHQRVRLELEETEKKCKLSERRYDKSVQKNITLLDQIEKAEKKLNNEKHKISEVENEYQKILLMSNEEKKKLVDRQSETQRAEEKLASIYREIDLALKQLDQKRTNQKTDLRAYFQPVEEKEIKMSDKKSPVSKKVLQQIEEDEKDQPEDMPLFLKQMGEDEIKQSSPPLNQAINQEEVVKDKEKPSESESPAAEIIPDDGESVFKSEPWSDGVCEDDSVLLADEEAFEKSVSSETKRISEDAHYPSEQRTFETSENKNKHSQTIIELASKDRLIRVIRTEKKFLISLYKAIVLSNKLGSLLFADSHNGTEGYLVRSLYFDSVDDRDYYEKEDGLLMRKKIRLRVYSPDDELVKLEKKEKHGDNQCKRTLNISRETAKQMILGNYDELFKNPHPFAQELYHDLVTGSYVPKCMVEYQRKAFIVPENDTRITIDSNIYASESSYDLFRESFNGYPVSHCDDVTLEVKYNNFLLSYVKDLLDSCQKTQVSYGKYYLGRSVGHGKYALFV